jgi:ketosteroid isomerase-like protein
MRARFVLLSIAVVVSLPLGPLPAFAQSADRPATGAPPSDPAAAAAAAIRSQFDRHVSAHRRGDPGAAAEMFTDDIRLIGPEGDETRGKAAMIAFYRETLDRWTLDEYNYATEEIVVSGEVAYQIGLWWFRMHDKANRAIGGRFQFMAVWRRGAGGAWRMERALWTPSAPDPAFGGGNAPR